MQHTTTTAISSGSSSRKNFAGKLSGVRSGIFALAATWILAASPVLAQQPPGGGGGGAPTTLSDLGCGPAEIARVNGAEEWDCSADLTANEAATAAAQATADDAANLAGQAHNLAGQAQNTADSALGEAFLARDEARIAQDMANHAIDVSQNAQVTADGALDAANNAQATADTALVLAEDAIIYLRTIAVSPVGPTASANGDELLAALDNAANAVPPPSADDPILISIEPGVYNVGTFQIDVPDFVGIRGSGEGLTRIVSEVGNGSALILRGNTVLSDLSYEQLGQFETGLLIAGTNVTLHDFSLSRTQSTNTTHNGIVLNSAAAAELRNVSVQKVWIAIRVQGGKATISEANTVQSTNGVFVLNGGTATIMDSHLQDLNDTSGFGLLVQDVDSEATFMNGIVSGVSAQASGLARVFGSRLRNASGVNGGGVIDIANSQITFGVSGAQASQITCVFSFDRFLSPLDNTCM